MKSVDFKIHRCLSQPKSPGARRGGLCDLSPTQQTFPINLVKERVPTVPGFHLELLAPCRLIFPASEHNGLQMSAACLTTRQMDHPSFSPVPATVHSRNETPRQAASGTPGLESRDAQRQSAPFTQIHTCLFRQSCTVGVRG